MLTLEIGPKLFEIANNVLIAVFIYSAIHGCWRALRSLQ